MSAVLVISGLAAEARIAGGAGVVTVAAPPAALSDKLTTVERDGIGAIVSFGLAGGLAPALAAGDLLIADAVAAGTVVHPCDTASVARLTLRMAGHGMALRRGRLAATDTPVMSPKAKAALAASADAVAVDTESQHAAALAARWGVPLVVLRAIADPADAALPPLAVRAIGPDGRLDFRAIAGELVRRPGQIGALPATGRQSARAFGTLRRVRAVLGPGLGLLL
ncbi:MAG: hypothetical protein AcusKO_11380 [Acuticoccus sp.]